MSDYKPGLRGFANLQGLPDPEDEIEALERKVADLLAASEDALWRWNGLTQERRDEITAMAPDPHAAAHQGEGT